MKSVKTLSILTVLVVQLLSGANMRPLAAAYVHLPEAESLSHGNRNHGEHEHVDHNAIDFVPHRYSHKHFPDGPEHAHSHQHLNCFAQAKYLLSQVIFDFAQTSDEESLFLNFYPRAILAPFLRLLFRPPIA